MKMPRPALLLYPGLFLALALPAMAQTPVVQTAFVPPDNPTANRNFFALLGDNIHQEHVNLGSCREGLKGIPGCAETLFYRNALPHCRREPRASKRDRRRPWFFRQVQSHHLPLLA
jgi:hypothetical protein